MSTAFQTTIEQLCEEQGWSPHEIDEQRAVLAFVMPSGRTQTLYAIGYDAMVEFSVPSFLRVDVSAAETISQSLMVQLLRRNAQRRLGFWCLEEFQETLFFSVMHNVALDQLDRTLFGSLVEELINECDAVEGMLEDAIQPSWDMIASILNERLTEALDAGVLTQAQLVGLLHASIESQAQGQALQNPFTDHELNGLIEGLDQFVVAALQTGPASNASITVPMMIDLYSSGRASLEEVLTALRDLLDSEGKSGSDPLLN